ncbi:radical SAM protein [Calorimonas adulescens]|uniref:Radical SAM protein n=1 Tax=Calorimonas adulescens TaxID=2606906 RepID=A0A5D8QCB2_9THEO|nr:radical SAM protein [Calorimonas adulescens]TZE82181.1 radical SAM protein [Calorimonas adulescens]
MIQIYNSLSQVPVFPKAINLELTNYCNLNCIMCTNGKDNFRGKGYMSNETINKILDEVIENKHMLINGVDICGVGEPLLHPEAINVINKLKFYNIRTMINTNGVLLDKEVAADLLESRIDKIMISLDAANRESYKKIKGIDVFEKVIDNITNLLILKNRKSYRTIIQINMLNMGENFSEIKDALLYWAEYLGENDVIYSRQVKTLAGEVKDLRSSTDITRNDLKSFKKALENEGINTEKLVVEDWEQIIEVIKNYGKLPCRHLWNYTMIFYNGDVTICCIDFNGKIVIDNVNNSSIKKIWNSEKYNNFRKIFISKDYEKIDLCSKCNEWYKCW